MFCLIFSCLNISFRVDNFKFVIFNFCIIFWSFISVYFLQDFFEIFLYISFFHWFFQTEVFEQTTNIASEEQVAREWVRMRASFIGSTHGRSDYLDGSQSWAKFRKELKCGSPIWEMVKFDELGAIGVVLDSVEILNKLVYFLIESCIFFRLNLVEVFFLFYFWDLFIFFKN